MSLKFVLKVKIVVEIFGILESLGRNKKYTSYDRELEYLTGILSTFLLPGRHCHGGYVLRWQNIDESGPNLSYHMEGRQ